jgi:hypothetical protein
MLTSGTQDREFEPGRRRRIFRARKSKAVCPMPQIYGMLKNAVIHVEVGIAGLIDRPFHAPTFVLHK